VNCTGKGQTYIPVIDFNGVVKLAMMIGGRQAVEYRVRMVDTIRRYLSGDPSLIPEIEANAASDAPIAQLARESLASDPVGEPAEALGDQPQQPKKRSLESEDGGCMLELEVLERKQKLDMSGLELFKRKQDLELEFMARKQTLELDTAERKQKLDLEAAELKQKLELEAAERKQKLELDAAELKQKIELDVLERKQQLAERQKIFALDSTDREMGSQTKLLQTYSTLCNDPQLADAQGRDVFKSNVLRLSTQTATVVEVKAEPVSTEEGEPDNGSTIGEMLTAMGHEFDANDTRMIGLRVFAAYRKMWGVPPVQRQVVTKEGVRRASIYSHGDCTLIDKVVAEYVAGKA